jgi:general secretion pathway protein I
MKLIYTQRCQTRIPLGFTLLEILVALAILTISMSALMVAASSHTSNISHLRNKTFAGIIASNKAEKLYLSKAWPTAGKSNGNIEMTRNEWHWEMNVQNTQDPSVRRAEISVFLNRKNKTPLVTLTTYLSKN